MSDTIEYSEARRAALKKYVRSNGLRARTKGQREDPGILPNTDPRVPVVVVQAGDPSKRPFFFLHVHVTGGAFYTFTLAREMGSDQPFYVLDPYKMDTMQQPPTLETMAEAYVRSLRAVQPEGPYLLGGFCGGGILAFEVAQQLHAAGQAVELVAMIEPRDGPAPHRMIPRKFMCGVFRHIGALCGLNVDQQLEWYLRIRHLRFHFSNSQYKSKDNSFFPKPKVLRQDWIGMFIWGAISQYHTQKYSGKLTYIWARKEPLYLRLWWGKIYEAEALETHLIPGTHIRCRNMYASEMGKRLHACLSDVLHLA